MFLDLCLQKVQTYKKIQANLVCNLWDLTCMQLAFLLQKSDAWWEGSLFLYVDCSVFLALPDCQIQFQLCVSSSMLLQCTEFISFLAWCPNSQTCRIQFVGIWKAVLIMPMCCALHLLLTFERNSTSSIQYFEYN